MNALQSISRYILFCIFALLLALFEVSFFSEFSNLRFIDFSLVILILLAGRVRLSFLLSAGAIAGFFLDVFSPFSFGGYLFAITIALGGAILLLHEVFTNRSMISYLFLIICGTALYHFSTLVFAYSTKTFGVHSIGLAFTTQWLVFFAAHGAANLLTGIIVIFGSRWMKEKFSRRFLFLSHENL